MFKENTKQVNRMMANIFAHCTVIILLMTICSCLGFFEFGETYTIIVLMAGLVVAVSPKILINAMPDHVMRCYMLMSAAIFIGILGTNIGIGIYITYILVPVFSCLYFDPEFTKKISIFSYIIMIISLYVESWDLYDVVYFHRSRMRMFAAYALGFTFEYMIVVIVLYFIVKRAKMMMEQRYSAEEESKMKSKFLSEVSHEIRTPMNAIIGMTDVVLRDREMSSELRKDIHIIKSSSTGLLSIINDILDMSKIESGKMEIIEQEYETDQLIQDMTAIINARNISQKVPIYYHICENLPKILCGDMGRIKQVMFNYASNAIKYTESGRIDITVSCVEQENEKINLRYQVKDTGCGIKQEDFDKLFIQYSQLEVEKNHSKEGTGIGLAICKYFVEQMDGSVKVESIYGEGSTFSFEIPQKIIETTTDAECQKEETEEEYLFQTNGARILLVDDNEINREVLKALVEPLNMVIDEAEDGKEAVSKTKEQKYDLIFMDSHMPKMDGKTATKKIRAMTDGMNDYIMKPVDSKMLCQKIRKYLPDKLIMAKSNDIQEYGK